MKFKQCEGCKSLGPPKHFNGFGWCELKDMNPKRVKKCKPQKQKSIKSKSFRTDSK